jgi:hypothetical protein
MFKCTYGDVHSKSRIDEIAKNIENYHTELKEIGITGIETIEIKNEHDLSAFFPSYPTTILVSKDIPPEVNNENYKKALKYIEINGKTILRSSRSYRATP